MSKISVIVPVYNAEKYLRECVESVLHQTLSDLELLLVDDGSTDSSPALCDTYAAQDHRVRVIHKQNGGVSTARNAGLDAAKGDYIAFVDSDDYIALDMYEKLLSKAEAYACDVVMCDCLKEFPDHSELYTHDIRGGHYDRQQLETEYFPHLLMMENVEYPATISNWLLLFRRELAEQVRYLSGVRYSEDLLFGAELMYRAGSFHYLKGQAYYHYRMNPQSATHKFSPDKWKDYLRLHCGIQDSFGCCRDFDFSHQIDLCLLFFLYNAVGDIMWTKQLSRSEKMTLICSILNDPAVRTMFRHLDIGSLPISAKQKLITWVYKHQLGVGAVVAYCSLK